MHARIGARPGHYAKNEHTLAHTCLRSARERREQRVLLVLPNRHERHGTYSYSPAEYSKASSMVSKSFEMYYYMCEIARWPGPFSTKTNTSATHILWPLVWLRVYVRVVSCSSRCSSVSRRGCRASKRMRQQLTASERERDDVAAAPLSRHFRRVAR